MDQATVERVDALVLEQDRLTTCFFCIIGRSSTCALGFQSCAWRNGGLGDFAATQQALPSEGRPL